MTLARVDWKMNGLLASSGAGNSSSTFCFLPGKLSARQEKRAPRKLSSGRQQKGITGREEAPRQKEQSRTCVPPPVRVVLYCVCVCVHARVFHFLPAINRFVSGRFLFLSSVSCYIYICIY